MATATFTQLLNSEVRYTRRHGPISSHRGQSVATELRSCVSESRGGRPGLPSLISLRFLWTLSNTTEPNFPEPRSCVNVEVDVLGSRP